MSAVTLLALSLLPRTLTKLITKPSMNQYKKSASSSVRFAISWTLAFCFRLRSREAETGRSQSQS